MSTLPESIRNAWNNRNGTVVVGTVDENGLPNLIYATRHPGHAALALRVEAAFSGAQPIPLA